MTITVNEKADSSVPQLTITTYNLGSKGAACVDDEPPTVTTPIRALHIEKQETNRSSPASPRVCGGRDPFETDLEAMMPAVECSPSSTTRMSCHGQNRKSLVLHTVNDASVWPGKEHWKREAKEAKIKRSCTCLARLSKRNRCIVKVLIIFFVVALAVGVGVGISKTLNTPIYGQEGYPPVR
jgi:hypothetical protein